MTVKKQIIHKSFIINYLYVFRFNKKIFIIDSQFLKKSNKVLKKNKNKSTPKVKSV